MLTRLKNRAIFELERFIQRGLLNQLVFIAALIVFVSLVAGMIVYLTVDAFDHFGKAVWWAFLRLTDPGYLGDDQDTVSRVVSTVVTVLGYVLFLGALIAIMTQALGGWLRHLEAGNTPIYRKGHILILGWTNRTAPIVKELLLSEGRVRRFLQPLKMSRLHIVIMADDVTSMLTSELRMELGELWDPETVTLRTGDPLKAEHLERTDFLNAAAIILPSGGSADSDAASQDSHSVKIMLSICRATDGDRRPPMLTAEIFDPQKISIAEAAYDGDLVVVPSAIVVSRLIAQNIRHNGLSHVYAELLSHSIGNEVYVREFPDAAGMPFDDLAQRLRRAIPIGVLRWSGIAYEPVLNPPAGMIVKAQDRIAYISESYDDLELLAAPSESESTPPEKRKHARNHEIISRRVLILGWSYKLPALLTELASYDHVNFHADVVSLVPAADREQFIRRYAGDFSRITVNYIEADYSAPNDLFALSPERYDNVVFLSSDRLSSGEEADARTLLGYMLLQQYFAGFDRKPNLLIELLDSDNADLFVGNRAEVIVSPELLSHMLAHVTLRRELSDIFEILFTKGGAEIYFLPPSEYLDSGNPVPFAELQRIVAAHGDIALGVFQPGRSGDGKRACRLNPPRDETFTFVPGDEVIVLTTYE
jgi:hypothetical protein